jgi:hypothetical protein
MQKKNKEITQIIFWYFTRLFVPLHHDTTKETTFGADTDGVESYRR